MPFFGKKMLNQKGWTLVELMVVTAIMGLIVPAITVFFIKVQQGYAADEMHNQLKKMNEETMLRINVRIKGNKHMFQNDAGGLGVSFLSKIQMAGTPATVAGTHMAVAQASTITSFSPTSSAPLSFGNSLFFAGFDSPGKNSSITWVAPLTVTGAGITYTTGGSASIILDVYRFYYYYLTPSRHPFVDVNSYGLVEWRSIQYVDFYQIDNISDSVLKTAVINWVSASGPAKFPGGPITIAWDPSETDPATAFYNLPAYTQLSPVTIKQQDWTYLSGISSGILSTGFRYGICGNTAGWKEAPQTVPQYATANSLYPGGFEVGLIGKGSGLAVLTRSLLVSKGYAPRVIWNDISMVHNAKDIW